MNILITGGNGFIAQHLTTYLKDKHVVINPTKHELNCLDANSVDTFFNTYKIDVVIHTALTGRNSLFSTDEKYYIEACTMWNNIVKHAEKYNKLIHFGSAYDTLDTPYGKGKKFIYDSCNNTVGFYNLRLYGNFHSTEHNSRFFKKLQSSTKFIIPEDKKFDYFYLEDIFPVVDLVLTESPTQRLFDLVYKEKYTLTDQAMEFSILNSVKTIIEVPGFGPDFIGNSDILYSFNLKLKGLTHGFKTYENSNRITSH